MSLALEATFAFAKVDPTQELADELAARWLPSLAPAALGVKTERRDDGAWRELPPKFPIPP